MTTTPSSEHSRGFKVRLQGSGTVGRCVEILDAADSDDSDAAVGRSADDGPSSADLLEQIRDEPAIIKSVTPRRTN